MKDEEKSLDNYLAESPEPRPIEWWLEKLWGDYIDIDEESWKIYEDLFVSWQNRLFDKEYSPERAAKIMSRAFKIYTFKTPKFEIGQKVIFSPKGKSFQDYITAIEEGNLHKGHISIGEMVTVKEYSTLKPTLKLEPWLRGFMISIEEGDILYAELDFVEARRNWTFRKLK